MLRFRLKRRDKYSLELKFIHSFGFDTEKRKKRVRGRRSARIILFLFLPKSFGIGPETYDEEDFFDGIKLYLRFDTPKVTTEDLAGHDPSVSPIARIERYLQGGISGKKDNVIYETKLLGAMIKSALRDGLKNPIDNSSSIEERCATFLDTIQKIETIQKRIKKITKSYQGEKIISEHICLLDEHISLTLEHYLAECLWGPQFSLSKSIRDQLISHLRRQQQYRADRGYPSSISDTDDHRKYEEYIYRMKYLKRYVSSVLFLKIRRGNQAKRVEHLTYAMAAGLAMAVATGVSFLSQIRLESLSSTLFLVLVGSYMIKDRIKDFFRAAFNRSLGRLFYDRRTIFRDPRLRRKLGIVKERVMFIKPNRVPEVIVKTRNEGRFKRVVLSASPENILEYEKKLIIFTDKLGEIDSRINGVADINIIDLKQLVRFLARRKYVIPVRSGNSVTTVETRRIYHLNAVVECRLDDFVSRRKIRLVVDSGGIRRVEYP